MKKILTSSAFLLTLIIIIASFFRLYNITPPTGGLPPGLYPDEAMDGTNAQEALQTGNFKVFYPENNGREGLFMNIQAPLIAVFGNEPWVLRIVSVFFGIFTVLGIYFLVKELLSYASSKISEKFKTSAALLSAFLLAINFWHINFSRISFRAIMAPFFITWALYFFFKAINSDYSKKYSVISGIIFGLGFYSYIAYRAMPALLLVVFFYDWLTRKEFRKRLLISTFYFLLFTIIVALPIGWYFLKNPQDFLGRTTEVSIFKSPNPLGTLAMNIVKTADMFNIAGDQNWRHNLSGRPELDWLAGVLFLVGIGISIRELFIKKEKANGGFFVSLFLFSFLVIAALPVVVSNEGIPHALRSIIMIPPVFILAGIGGVWLYEFVKLRMNTNPNTNFTNKLKFVLHALCFIIIAAATAQSYYTYFIAWGQNPNVQGAFAADYAQIGRDLNTLPQSTPKYVIVEAGGVLVRGIPMPAQTVMFLTDTFTPEKQAQKNMHYVLPDQVSQIPAGAYVTYIK